MILLPQYNAHFYSFFYLDLSEISHLKQNKMKYLKLVFVFLLGALMVLSGYGHFANQALSDNFIPNFLPKQLVHFVTGIVELTLGVGLLLPQYRTQAAWGIFGLMIAFLPLHVTDLFREQPIIGSVKAAQIRVPVQFLLIFMAWFIAKKEQPTT